MKRLSFLALVLLLTVIVLTFQCQALQSLGGGGLSDEEMGKLGAQAFEDLKKKVPVENEPRVNAYIRCIATSIIAVTQDPTGVKQWEVVVFRDQTANAFALPGGKIGVHTGLLAIANNRDMVATVMGHEIGHVIKRHGMQRMVQSGILEKGLGVLGEVVLGQSANKDTIVGVLGTGAAYGVLMPFSRSHETEADGVGLQLMADAGFDPTQSVILWKQMSIAGGGKKQPELLSTHPSDENRIKNLSSKMNDAATRAAAARAQGRNPTCSM